MLRLIEISLIRLSDLVKEGRISSMLLVYMAEHDFIIDNGTGSAVRSDINSVLQAIASNNSKSGALTTNYAFQWHVDTSDGLLKIRNAANNGYVTV